MATVDTLHPQYVAAADTWRTLRDAFDGSEAIRAGGERYVPRPSGMRRNTPNGDAMWAAYLQRPEWLNATRRTVADLVGRILRKDPNITGLEQLAEHPLQLDITGTGVSLSGMLKESLQETIHMGRDGILLDITTEDFLQTPVWAGYATEHIWNWHVSLRTGRLEMVVLEETEEGLSADTAFTTQDGFTMAFGTETVKNLRVLSLDDDGLYRVDRLRLDTQTVGGTTEVRIVQIEPPIFPDRRGQRLDFIPFQFFGPEHLDPDVQQSSIWGLVRLNLRHWRHSADYEHGLHYTALPTPWVTGHNPELDYVVNESGKVEERDTMVLGSGEAMTYPEPEAKVGLLTLSDSEFGALKAALDNDKNEMATHGARLLEDRPDVMETATAMRLRHSGDESVLKSLALTASEGFTRLLRWHMWWAGLAATRDDEKISLALNTDFMSLRLTHQDIVALQGLHDDGHISKETVYYNIQQGEVSQPAISFEEEQVRIENRPPIGMRLLNLDNPDAADALEE